MRAILVALSIGLALGNASGGAKRSQGAKADFKRLNPCPANQQRRGPCPGYVIDHIDPLACGGADLPSNMQWQTVADARQKDKWEAKGCRGGSRMGIFP